MGAIKIENGQVIVNILRFIFFALDVICRVFIKTKKKTKKRQTAIDAARTLHVPLNRDIYEKRCVYSIKKSFLSKSLIYLSDAAEGVRQRHLVLTDVNAPMVIVPSMLRTPASAPSSSKIGTAGV